MTEKELVKCVAEATGRTHADVKMVIGAVQNSIVHNLKKGEEVGIRGFGTWKKVRRNARMWRNPRTGEVIEIPERNGIKFVPGKLLKGAMENEN